MIASRRLLIFGGLVLATLGIFYGVYYAAFAEHQALNQMGSSLALSFAAAASRDSVQSKSALQQYGETKYDYVRDVDFHSHWVGLSMILIVLGVIFEHVHFSESIRTTLAVCLLVGSLMFPLAVFLQTYFHGASIFKALAVVGPALIIVSLAGTAWGFARASTGSLRNDVV